MYRLPDGSEYVWESRRHRNGRGPRKTSGQAGVEAAAERTIEAAKKSPWLGVWAPYRLSWWVGLVFIVGSAGFVVGAVSGIDIIGLTSVGHSLLVKLGYLSGSVLFPIGSYLMLPELAFE